MDLPDVQRGMAILADHIQRINAAIRQARLRPGVGYLLKESSGGTSLVIDRGTIGGGGGGGGAPANPCPFGLSDYSEPGENGQLILKVKVEKGLVANRWPDGMSLTSGDYLLDITETCYVWMVLEYKPDDVELIDEDTAITIMASPDLQVNTETTQYELIGTVTVSPGGPADGNYISNISSVCGRIEAQPCSLAWSTGGG